MGRHARWEPPNPVLRDHRAPRGGILVLPPAAKIVAYDAAGNPSTTDEVDPLDFLFADRSFVRPGCDCDYCTWIVDAEIIEDATDPEG